MNLSPEIERLSIPTLWWSRYPLNMFRLASGLLLLLFAAPVTSQATDSTSIHPRGESSSDRCSTRTLFNIISCVSTTIIRAWAALHPNIPPRGGPIIGALRTVESMLSTIVAPEILPTWAFNQLLGAATVKNVYNEAKSGLICLFQ